MYMTMNSRPMDPTSTPGGRPQQPWSYPKFVAEYNAYADQHGGYYYDPASRTERLEEHYRKSAHPTIKAYAWGVYQHDQMY